MIWRYSFKYSLYKISIEFSSSELCYSGLITINIVIIMLSIFINLAFAEQNDVIVIEKP